MGNLRDPSKPLGDPAFDALVAFVLDGARPAPKLSLVEEMAQAEAKDLAPFIESAVVEELFGTAPLRQLGLSDEEIMAMVCFADRNGRPVLEVAGEWLRCVMDTLTQVGELGS